MQERGPLSPGDYIVISSFLQTNNHPWSPTCGFMNHWQLHLWLVALEVYEILHCECDGPWANIQLFEHFVHFSLQLNTANAEISY